jgi:PAS domain S-box-containing protein
MESESMVIGELDVLREQIAELKKIEIRRDENEDWHCILAGVIQEGIWLIDAENKTKFVNRKMAEMLGYTVDEITGRLLFDFISIEDRISIAETDAEYLYHKVFKQKEFKFCRKDGSDLWVRLSDDTIFDKNGQYAGRLVLITDTTACREAENELRHANHALKMLSEFNQTMVRVTDERALFQEACRVIVGAGGYRFAFVGFIDQNKSGIVYPVAAAGCEEGPLDTASISWAGADQNDSPTRTAIQTRRPFITRNILTDSGFFPWRAEAIKKGYASSIVLPLVSDDQVFGVFKIYAIGSDVFNSEEEKLLVDLVADLSYGIASLRTREKRKEIMEAFIESEEKYRTMVEYSNDLIWTLDRNGNITYANKRAEEVSGYKLSDWLGKGFASMMAPDDLARTKDIFLKTLSGRPMQYEVTVYREDKSAFVLSVNKAPIFKNNEIVGAVSFGRDVTESNRVEEALRHSEREKALILESVSDLVVYQDREHKVIWANSVAGESVNQMAEELVGRYCYEIWHQRTEPCINCSVTEAFETGKLHKGEIISPDGREWLMEASPVRGINGDVIGVVEVTQEITERKRMEKELEQSLEKLKRIMEETISALATTVEIRDPYTAGHQQRVSKIACEIAREMGFTEDEIEGIRMAGLAHDIGKIHVPAEILSKPGIISELEFDIVKTHPQVGYDILKPIEFSCPIAQMVLQHHERMDGSGYPAGFSGDEIILEARILAVADVVEAMSSHRPYRPALGVDKALEEISQNRGILYDADVVDVCLALFREKGFKFD